MPNFIKYLTDIRAYFIIKIELRKIKLYLYNYQTNYFLKKYYQTNSNIWEVNSYFCRLNFKNIKIIVHIPPPGISKFCSGSVNIISFLLYFIRRIVIMLRKITRSKMSVIGPLQRKSRAVRSKLLPFCIIDAKVKDSCQ